MLSTLLRQVRFAALSGITSFVIITAASAQGPGVAASVTSHGFGGHAGASGVPASVTAHGSFAPNHSIVMHSPIVVNRGFGVHPVHPVHNPHRFHHSFPGTVVYGFPYYPYSYYYDDDDYQEQAVQNSEQDQQYENQQQYEDQYSNGGQTIFDRRSPGPEYQTWREQNQPGPEPATAQTASNSNSNSNSNSEEPKPEPAAPPTVLVFKDGHQVEVANYAIVGATLFDLTPGHPRRVPISDLDLNATQKQNDDRGVDFRLPAGM
jgi:hypothetical protein